MRRSNKRQRSQPTVPTIRQKTRFVSVLQRLFQLYPQAYRNDYEEEMLYLAMTLLGETCSRWQQARLVYRLLDDFARNVIRQNLSALQRRVDERPVYLKQAALASIILTSPYIFMCAYNLVFGNVFHRTTILMQWEAHSWALYCIILPAAALVIVLTAAAIRLYNSFRTGDVLHQGPGLTQDALMLGVPLTLITTVVLL